VGHADKTDECSSEADHEQRRRGLVQAVELGEQGVCFVRLMERSVPLG
jgi:hypothetical protein